MELSDKPALVIDNGSGLVKAGFAGEASPCVEFPSIVGVPKYKKSIKHHNRDEYDGRDKDTQNPSTTYVGAEAYQKKGVLKLVYPI